MIKLQLRVDVLSGGFGSGIRPAWEKLHLVLPPNGPRRWSDIPTSGRSKAAQN
ncbi:hypothetical protein GCM10023193_22700 [Planotetraspora kaengkrachanensis]|uniref:Uncharacterized protein n=1 Tax=Planotetraspora kaengkrachanensis TaxID=575193 RepID=A0A8J3LVS9_9ACTN|nr:hypothetical protein Pka01_31450 [Planotetraspora kaengkrachanensis]